MKDKISSVFKSKTFIICAVLIAAMLIVLLYTQLSVPSKSENGFLYSIDSGCATLKGYSGKDTELVVPETLGGCEVTSVKYGAFSGKTSIVSISLPQSVVSIGINAFSGCTSLSEIKTGNGIYEIGSSAFEDTAWLNSQPPGYVVLNNQYLISYTGEEKDIVLPSGVTLVADRAFYASDIRSFDSSDARYLGVNCFRLCQKLSSVTLHEGLLIINESCFADCDALISVVIPKSCKKLMNNAFYSCSALTNADLPDDVVLSYSTFAETPFIEAHKEKYVILGDGILVAYNGSEDDTVYIPQGVKTISDCVFQDHSEILFVTIPEGVTEIGVYAFKDCTGIQRVDFPTTVAHIGVSAFENCTLMKTDSYPESAQIDSNAFMNTEYESSSTKALSTAIIGITIGVMVFVTAYMITRVGKMRKINKDGLK